MGTLLGSAPDGVFSQFSALADGDLVPGEWWRVTDGDEIVGYGWMDVSWGWAPVLVATRSDQQGRGVGSFAMDQLAAEAHARGLSYVFNVIPATHPDADGLAAWLQARGFEPAQADGRMLRRRTPGTE